MKPLLLSGIFCLFLLSSQAQKTQVMTLGTFHFHFPNLDVRKIDQENQIDVLSPEYQREIQSIANNIAAFAPTIIAIEVAPERQQKYDSLYQSYLAGKHELSRSESQQIGFRIAQQLGLQKLYCVDDMGRFYEDIDQLFAADDSQEKKDFISFLFSNPDSLLMSKSEFNFKENDITSHLISFNDPALQYDQLGDYLIGIFKYETEEKPFMGPDFVSGWWFNRNLRIFRNIQKIPTTADDRILVIFGAGHMNLLNVYFKASPEYELVDVRDYLKK